jgi:predicted Zn-dependent protease
MITGMTRDGTFQIRNGKRGNPVRNLRFTVNVLEVLKNIVAISSETRLVEGVCGPVCVPALKVRKFAFTGVSDQ